MFGINFNFERFLWRVWLWWNLVVVCWLCFTWAKLHWNAWAAEWFGLSKPSQLDYSPVNLCQWTMKTYMKYIQIIKLFFLPQKINHTHFANNLLTKQWYLLLGFTTARCLETVTQQSFPKVLLKNGVYLGRIRKKSPNQTKSKTMIRGSKLLVLGMALP